MNKYTVVFAPLYPGEMPFVQHIEAEGRWEAVDGAVNQVRRQLDASALATAEPPETIDGAMERLTHVVTFEGWHKAVLQGH